VRLVSSAARSFGLRRIFGSFGSLKSPRGAPWLFLPSATGDGMSKKRFVESHKYFGSGAANANQKFAKRPDQRRTARRSGRRWRLLE
jgi:hypothetical protein